jgi:hypothetical protein
VHFICPSAAPVVPISLSCRGSAFEIPGRSADQRSLLTLAVLVRTLVVQPSHQKRAPKYERPDALKPALLARITLNAGMPALVQQRF